MIEAEREISNEAPARPAVNALQEAAVNEMMAPEFRFPHPHPQPHPHPEPPPHHKHHPRPLPGPDWCRPGDVLVVKPFPYPHKECVRR